MSKTVLTISSKNYGAWSLRGWLMARLAGSHSRNTSSRPMTPP